MIQALTLHLWQSTFFALAAGLLTVAFRRNRAQVRFWLWLSASLKFAVPFALLMSLGTSLEPLAPGARQIATQIATPVVAYTIEQFGEPSLPGRSPSQTPGPVTANWIPTALFSLWLCGFTALALVRLRNWLRVRNAVRASCPTDLQTAVEVRTSSGLLEPGVVGLWRATLLLPTGIEARLSPSELNAVLAHELCHIRRRDNLVAAIHMMVEAIFWFHPLVWWIGARLVEERERACDEEVLSLGNKPDVYADAILNVCKLYVESPLACVSGVSGACIRQRIEAILSNRALEKLNRTKKFLLAGAGFATVALPILVGVLIGIGHPLAIRAQSPVPAAAQTVTTPAPIQLTQVQAPAIPHTPEPPAVRPKFEVASIRPCDPGATVPGGRGGRGGGGGGGAGPSPDRITRNCVTLMTLLQEAYVRFADGQNRSPFSLQIPPIEGAPGWLDSERFTIEAKAEGDANTMPMMLGPMMQSLIEDRFHLKFHRETRNVPAYELTVAKGGSKLKPAVNDDAKCSLDMGIIPKGPDGTPLPGFGPNGHFEIPGSRPPGETCHLSFTVNSGLNKLLVARGMKLDDFTALLVRITDHPVTDKTGLTGEFDMRLEFARDSGTSGATAGLADVSTDIPAGSTLFTAIEEQLGLKLVPVQGTREFIVIDRIERPSEN